jgi:hypothetical protein
MNELEKIVKDEKINDEPKKGLMSRIVKSKVGNSLLGLGALAALYLGFGPTVAGAKPGITANTNDYSIRFDKVNDTAECIIGSYNVHYGNQSGSSYNGTGLLEGNSPININISSFLNPNRPKYSLHSFQTDSTYFLKVSAESITNEEGPLSNEVNTSNVPVNFPPSVNLTSNSTNINLGDSAVFNAEATDSEGSVDGREWYVSHGDDKSIFERSVIGGDSLTIDDFPQAGVYRVTHTAIDNNNSHTSKINNIAVGLSSDGNAPTIDIENFNPTVVGDTLERRGYIRDNTAIDIDSIKVEIINSLGTTDITDQMKLTYIDPRTVLFMTGVKNVPEGNNTVLLTAKDVFEQQRMYGSGQTNLASELDDPVIEDQEGTVVEGTFDSGYDTIEATLGGTSIPVYSSNGKFFIIPDGNNPDHLGQQNLTIEFNSDEGHYTSIDSDIEVLPNIVLGVGNIYDWSYSRDALEPQIDENFFNGRNGLQIGAGTDSYESRGTYKNPNVDSIDFSAYANGRFTMDFFVNDVNQINTLQKRLRSSDTSATINISAEHIVDGYNIISFPMNQLSGIESMVDFTWDVTSIYKNSNSDPIPLGDVAFGKMEIFQNNILPLELTQISYSRDCVGVEEVEIDGEQYYKLDIDQLGNNRSTLKIYYTATNINDIKEKGGYFLWNINSPESIDSGEFRISQDLNGSMSAYHDNITPGNKYLMTELGDTSDVDNVTNRIAINLYGTNFDGDIYISKKMYFVANQD